LLLLLWLFSPSDLDADLEDNQDYDSTVSQSEVNSSRTHSATTLQTIMSLTPRRADNHDELTEKNRVQTVACAEKSPGVDLQQVIAICSLHLSVKVLM
jgi:hypothetical protein